MPWLCIRPSVTSQSGIDIAEGIELDTWSTLCRNGSVKCSDNMCHIEHMYQHTDISYLFIYYCFSALTLLVGRQEGHEAYKTQWLGAGMVICLEWGADLHMAQLMSPLLTVSCFSKIHTGFNFLVPTHPGSPGKKAIKCVSLSYLLIYSQSLTINIKNA